MEARNSLRGRTADDQGIYWNEQEIERGPDAGKKYWIADKLYGKNVVVSWFTERGRGLDDRWKRLDRLLLAITGD